MRIAPAALLVAPLALAACGSTQSAPAPDPAIAYAKTAPATIVADGLKGFALVNSARVQADLVQAGQRRTMDVRIQDATHCTGTMTMKGASVQFVIDGASVYMNGGQQFWTNQAGPGAAALLAGRWLTGFPQAAASQIGEGCQLIEQFQKDTKDAPHGAAVLGTGAVDGVSVVRVKSIDKTTGKAGEIDVSATEPHTVVKISGEGNTITISEINQPVAIAPPAGAVDISTLQH